MEVTGFIVKDEQGQEFVVVCEKPYRQPWKAFALRGWQRRRMVPLQHTGQELRHMTKGVRRTLNDLLQRLPSVREDVYPALFTRVRDESAETRREMGARRPGD